MDPLQLSLLIEIAEKQTPESDISYLKKVKQICLTYKKKIELYEYQGNNKKAILILCQLLRFYIFCLWRRTPKNHKVNKNLKVCLLYFLENTKKLQQELNDYSEIIEFDIVDWKTGKIKK